MLFSSKQTHQSVRLIHSSNGSKVDICDQENQKDTPAGTAVIWVDLDQMSENLEALLGSPERVICHPKIPNIPFSGNAESSSSYHVIVALTGSLVPTGVNVTHHRGQLHTSPGQSRYLWVNITQQRGQAHGSDTAHLAAAAAALTPLCSGACCS